jgi:hypothetical protein
LASEGFFVGSRAATVLNGGARCVLGAIDDDEEDENDDDDDDDDDDVDVDDDDDDDPFDFDENTEEDEDEDDDPRFFARRSDRDRLLVRMGSCAPGSMELPTSEEG